MLFSGNEAKKSLKIKEITFLNVHKRRFLAAQKSSFSTLKSQESTHFGEIEAKVSAFEVGVQLTISRLQEVPVPRVAYLPPRVRS